MPAKGYRKAEPVDVRLKVQLTAEQAAELAHKADAAGMTVAGYLRALVAHDLGNTGHKPRKPAVQKRRDVQHLASEVHVLAMQVKKLGVNINQLAHQANTGMVPIRRDEVQHMLSRHEVLIAMAIDRIDKALG